MSPPPSLEAKIVILGSQSVGKTSLVHRYVANTWIPPHKVQTTVGAAFLTTKVADPESGCTIRLQIWDTAGQERFRALSRLYYRGAHAAILCYDITSRESFEDVGRWLQELREHCGGTEEGGGMILHVVGTKADVVAADPKAREVPFERCIGYVAEQLYPSSSRGASVLGGGDHPSPAGAGFFTNPGTPLHHPLGTPTTPALSGHPPAAPSSGGGAGARIRHSASAIGATHLASAQSHLHATTTTNNNPHTNSYFNLATTPLLPDHVWDCCHEVSAKSGEGVEEIFRVVTRKLVDRHLGHLAQRNLLTQAVSGGGGGGGANATVPAGIGHARGRSLGTAAALIGSGGAGEKGYFDLPHGGGHARHLSHHHHLAGAGGGNPGPTTGVDAYGFPTNNGSFRVGVGDKRRSWLGALAASAGVDGGSGAEEEEGQGAGARRGRCC